MSGMLLTVTIQTYNHADSLSQTLRSLEGLRCPADAEYEILVIDNNSCDHTASVIKEFSSVLGPRLRSVFEPQQGLSHARNRAIAEARGDILCFLDDDALADPDWLVGHAEAYGTDEHIVAVGGRVELQWPEGWSRPPWFAGDLDGYLSGFDLGPGSLSMEYPRYPYGCNMSVRCRIAREIGGFCVRLGRRKNNLLSNEERYFFYRIHQQGGRVVYAPRAIVHHMIPAERLSKRFFLKRGYAQGISDILFSQEIAPDQKDFGSRARALLSGLKHLAIAGVNASGCLVHRRDAGACFLGLVRGAYAIGCVAGATGYAR